MEKRDYRFYIQVRTFFGDTPTAIHQDLVAFGGEKAVTYQTVLNGHKSFSKGIMDLEDVPRSGRPLTALTTENIDAIRGLIEDDPHATCDDLEAATQLLRGTIKTIIHDHLQKVKIASRWIPYKLTSEQKRKRVKICRENLEKLESCQWRLGDIVTGDETWIYFRQIGHKQSNYTWRNKGDAPNTVVRRENFEGKRLYYSIFFKANGWVAVHALDKGQTLDRTYYIENCLQLVVKTLKKERPNSGMRGLKLLHDNAKPHVNSEVLTYLRDQEFQVMPHPPYSPDLAPCDYWLNDYIKCNLTEQKDEDSLFEAVTKVLNNIPEEEYRKTFDKLVKRIRLFIKNKGDYFEHLLP